MKVLLKIIFAPIIFVLWLFVKIASIITYLSGIVFGIISGIVVAISFVHLVIGSVSNAIIGFILAYLLSPHGIPLFVIILLGSVQGFRYKIHDMVYGF